MSPEELQRQRHVASPPHQQAKKKTLQKARIAVQILQRVQDIETISQMSMNRKNRKPYSKNMCILKHRAMLCFKQFYHKTTHFILREDIWWVLHITCADIVCDLLWLHSFQDSILISIYQGGKNVALRQPHHLCSCKTRTPTTTLFTHQAPFLWRMATRSPTVTQRCTFWHSELKPHNFFY